MTEGKKKMQWKRLEESKSCRLWYEGKKFEFYSKILKKSKKKTLKQTTKFKLKKRGGGIRFLFAKLSFAIAIED